MNNKHNYNLCDRPDSNEIQKLREALAREWASNHYEHCGAEFPPWPHSGTCKWPLPKVLALVVPNEASLLLLVSSEEDP